MHVVSCPCCSSTDLERHCKKCADCVCNVCRAHFDPTPRRDGTYRWCRPIKETST